MSEFSIGTTIGDIKSVLGCMIPGMGVVALCIGGFWIISPNSPLRQTEAPTPTSTPSRTPLAPLAPTETVSPPLRDCLPIGVGGNAWRTNQNLIGRNQISPPYDVYYFDLLPGALEIPPDAQGVKQDETKLPRLVGPEDQICHYPFKPSGRLFTNPHAGRPPMRNNFNPNGRTSVRMVTRH
ncbi:MAG: hypothetical protein AAB929_00270 [Patescibacteria group bacterium]